MTAPGDPPASEALLEQFRAISTVFDSANVVLYVADLQTYEVLFVNAHTAALFGNFVGKTCYSSLQVGQTGPCAFCTNSRLLQDGKPGPPVVWEFQNTVTKRWFLCIDKAIPWIDGRLVRMEVAVDITARKEAEQFRAQYTSLVSHDLRNPLTALSLRAARLQRALKEKGLVKEEAAAQSILSSARRMDSLLAELLESTQLENSQVELRRGPMELGAFVRETLSELEPAEHLARVRIAHGDAPVRVLADPERLYRVVENVVSNALRYSSGEVKVSVESRGQEAVVCVSDRGAGIPSDEIPRLFQRFYRARTSSPVKGLGLGLYISRLILEAHQGRIWAESTEGVGSSFFFALPLAAEVPAP